jgi:NAD(P)H-quinone oxidoreductase subunit N
VWLLEGQVLSQSELETLIDICTKDNKLKIVVEMGGSRKLEWKALSDYILDEF